MDNKKKAWAINALRRASYRWYGRWQAEKASKVGRNQYVCNMCKGIFGKKDTQLDHVIPCVNPETGFVGFDEYIDKLLCNPEGYQRLCIECHSQKTASENVVRKETKAAKRKSPAKRKPKSK
jgi:5-methylcytosine-specific restriction endonuclease McrA